MPETWGDLIIVAACVFFLWLAFQLDQRAERRHRHDQAHRQRRLK